MMADTIDDAWRLSECPHIGHGAPKACCDICLGKPPEHTKDRVAEEVTIRVPSKHCMWCNEEFHVGQIAARVFAGPTTRLACLSCAEGW